LINVQLAISTLTTLRLRRKLSNKQYVQQEVDYWWNYPMYYYKTFITIINTLFCQV